MIHSTKQRLLSVGLEKLLERGYADLGIQAVLDAAEVPKGSFYHHFKDKQDFALQVVEAYMKEVHAALDACLGDRKRAPLERVRGFFEAVRQSYEKEGYLGCLLGGLGQELSGVNETFRLRMEWCFTIIGDRLAGCLEEARNAGQLSPDADPRKLSRLLVNCWEGAALRSRMTRDPAPLGEMLDFYFRAARRG